MSPTATKPRINRDAVRLIHELYEIDMEATQHSKTIDEIPKAGIVITMGCNMQCPIFPSDYFALNTLAIQTHQPRLVDSDVFFDKRIRGDSP